jgi:hypothetical protein
MDSAPELGTRELRPHELELLRQMVRQGSREPSMSELLREMLLARRLFPQSYAQPSFVQGLCVGAAVTAVVLLVPVALSAFMF